jgi:hypothetical protein
MDFSEQYHIEGGADDVRCDEKSIYDWIRDTLICRMDEYLAVVVYLCCLHLGVFSLIPILRRHDKVVHSKVIQHFVSDTLYQINYFL